MIANLSKEKKTLVDFVEENPQLLDLFLERYDWYDRTKFTQQAMLDSAAKENISFGPKERRCCTFGDEQGTLIGQVYDYVLRDGGVSENFEWFCVSCRGGDWNGGED